MGRSRAWIACWILIAVSTAAPAQTRSPRDFPELRGTWILDETATPSLRVNGGRAGGLIDGLGFHAARQLVISTTPTDISLTKDGAPPELYGFDGRERQIRDQRTGALLDRSLRFTLVAGMVALTMTEGGAGGYATIVTDAYQAGVDVLTVERQHSVLVLPGGYLAALANPNRQQTLIYRRAER